MHMYITHVHTFRQIQQIFDDPDTAVTPGEEHLAALTSAER